MSECDWRDGWRGELRRLLEPLVRAGALTDPAARKLVAGAAREDASMGRVEIGNGHPSRSVRMIVQGSLRMECVLSARRRRTIDILSKGEFVCFPRAAAWGMDATVHEGPVALALLPFDLWMRVLDELPPDNAGRLLSWSWRAACRRRYERERLELMNGTRERLCEQLASLAVRFGRTLPDGWRRIDVYLPQKLLGELISRTRSTVSRAFSGLCRDGLMRRTESRILVSPSVWTPGGPGSKP